MYILLGKVMTSVAKLHDSSSRHFKSLACCQAAELIGVNLTHIPAFLIL